MEISIVKSEKQKKISWSGGLSTELFIFPQNADYDKREFDFRISTATVEIDKSDFTPLPGFNRKIMVLDGAIKITHKNHYTKKLNKFDTDDFQGNWFTSSIGKCTDFNLMTNTNTKGNISSQIGKVTEELSYKINSPLSWLFIYIYAGKVTFDNKKQTLNKGDFLKIYHPEIFQLNFNCFENSELVFTEIL